MHTLMAHSTKLGQEPTDKLEPLLITSTILDGVLITTFL